MRKLIIAIDGPAASGKSTAARLLANELSYVYIDTGAMYRACALAAQKAGVDISDEVSLRDLMADISIKISYSAVGNKIFLDDEDVTVAIRKPEISALSSAISAFAIVRERMVQLQREMGKVGAVILDGRDIGTVVFPNADLKFFFVASAEIRAKRRYDELLLGGMNPDFDTVLQEIIDRDKADSSRALAPLTPAKDAIRIDTGTLTIDEMVAKLLHYYHIKSEQA